MCKPLRDRAYVLVLLPYTEILSISRAIQCRRGTRVRAEREIGTHSLYQKLFFGKHKALLIVDRARRGMTDGFIGISFDLGAAFISHD